MSGIIKKKLDRQRDELTTKKTARGEEKGGRGKEGHREKKGEIDISNNEITPDKAVAQNILCDDIISI